MKTNFITTFSLSYEDDGVYHVKSSEQPSCTGYPYECCIDIYYYFDLSHAFGNIKWWLLLQKQFRMKMKLVAPIFALHFPSVDLWLCDFS
jgi:hypothetical protein